MLQADSDSPLLESPPPDFYEGSSEHRTTAGELIKTAIIGLKLSNSSPDLKQSNDSNDIKATPSESSDAETTQAWTDLRVLRKSKNNTSQTTLTVDDAQHREFLAAGRYNGHCLIGDIVV